MSYSQYCARFAAAVTLLCGGMSAAVVHAATLTVGPPPVNTYATVEAAFTAAVAGDTIVLDEAGSPYALTQELVVTVGKSPLRIQGQSSNNERPDEIVVTGAPGGPAITVEQDAELTLRHLTVGGGTTGIQVLRDSRVTLERVYVSGTGAEGMSVTGAEFVDITGSIFNACGGEGIIVNSGTVDASQCTFIDNTEEAIRLTGGSCEVGASYFYNNNGGIGTDQLSATVAGLSIDYCGVVQGTVSANVVETNDVEGTAGFTPVMAAAFADPENLLFDPASLWRGAVLLPVTTGADSTTVNTDAPFGRDFLNRTRVTTDVQVGAHEFGASASGLTWVNCVVTQFNNPTPGLVGLGRIDIEIEVVLGDLVGAKLYLVPEPPRGDVTNNNMFIPILVDSTPANANYGIASLTLTDSFMTAPGGAELLLDGLAELYLQLPGSATNTFPDGASAAEFGTGYNDSAIDVPAQEGRFFVIDTLPPIITGFRVNRAHDYVVGHNDVLAPTVPDATGGALSVPWSAIINAPLASSVGVLDGETGGADPHLFFNERTGRLDFTIRMEFTDSNALIVDTTTYPISENGGFLPAPPAQTATGNAILPLLQNPAALNQPTAGFAWWDQVKALPIDAASGLTITYAGGGRDAGGDSQPLEVTWDFSGILTDNASGFGFWEAVAQFGVEDLVGNASGAAISNDPFRYALNPFHIWQLFDVAGTMKGPGYSETTSPVINWGVQRFLGVSPQNTDNAYPICQYAVYYNPVVGDPNNFGWEFADLAGGIEWSDWIATRRIDKYTRFSAATNSVLGDIIQRQGMYMIVVRTADEAGNVVGMGSYPATVGGISLSTIPAFFPADTWINGGPSVSLDTRVTPTFWHNLPGFDARKPDRGEKVFGNATQIPLPSLEFCERVEAGFTITMDLPDSVSPTAAKVYFELFEDGRLAAQGEIAGLAGSSDVTLVIPEDLLNPPANLIVVDPIPPTNDFDFLNASECGTRDRLGDDGLLTAEPTPRQRNVKYQLVMATQLAGDRDPTPATVEFTVTVDRAFKDEQPIKSFAKE